MARKVRPFLWFNDKAQEAATFYVSVFENSKIVSSGDNMAVFELNDEQIIAFNGGPHFTFTPAISLFVDCQTQEEVDEYWEKLSEGGEKGRCGWLTDKYGLSWQIVPSILGDLLDDEDPAKSERVMNAMLQMTKLDIAELKRAYAGA